MPHEGYTLSGRPVWTDRDGWHAWRITGTYPDRAAVEQAAASQDQQDQEQQMTDNLPAVPVVQGELVRTDMRDRATDSWTSVASDLIKLGTVVGPTEFVPKGLRTPEKATAAMLYARELGMPPMTGLASIHVIEGKPGLAAEAMRAMILAAGHDFRIAESTEARCVIRCRRKTWAPDDWSTYTFTFAEAVKAGVTHKDNWKNSPADMLVARCTTRAARRDFADVIHGMRSVEELQDMTEETVVPSVPPPAAPRGETVQRRQVGGPAAAPSREPGGEGDTGTAGEGTPDTVPSPPPARQRPPIKARGSKPPAPADVPADPYSETVEASQAEIQALADAHRGDRQAGGGPLRPPSLDQGDVEKINPQQRARLMAEFTRLKVERDDRLRVTTEIVGRLVETANDLTSAEASKVIDLISVPKDARALVAAIATLPDPDEPGEGE